MNAFQALKRLEAWKEGRPLPRGETLHFPIARDEDLLVLAFVRMGGESAPWGIAAGHPDGEPVMHVVPEPRDRELVARMAAEFAPTLLGHLLHPAHTNLRVTKEEGPFRQVWLPNGSHVDMLHHLNYAYTFARRGDPERVVLLNALGRATGWLFRESNQPGQVTVVSGCDALRGSYTFPCEDARQGHLGYLLGWLETRGGRGARLVVARDAERRSMSTSLDPTLEKNELAERVERYGEAQREERSSDERKARQEIGAVLRQELKHRFDLTVRAIARLRADRRRTNRGVAELIADGWSSQWWGYLYTEVRLHTNPGARVFIPSPETDRNPAAAAEAYFAQKASEERKMNLLLDDDREMQAEALAAGEAIYGTIRRVRAEVSGQTTTPVWEVETDGEAPTKLRTGKDVFVARLRSRKGRIRNVTVVKGNTRFTIEITALKKLPKVNQGGRVLAATDERLVGTTVVLLPAALEGIEHIKRRKLREKDAPGSWLTDARPAGHKAVLPGEVAGPDSLSHLGELTR